MKERFRLEIRRNFLCGAGHAQTGYQGESVGSHPLQLPNWVRL